MVYGYNAEPLFLPESDGAWKERMRVQVHALGAQCYGMGSQGLEQGRGEPMPAVLRENKQANDFYSPAGPLLFKNRQLQRRRRRSGRRRRSTRRAPQRIRQMRKPVVKRRVRYRGHDAPAAAARNQHTAPLQDARVVQQRIVADRGE